MNAEKKQHLGAPETQAGVTQIIKFKSDAALTQLLLLLHCLRI